MEVLSMKTYIGPSYIATQLNIMTCVQLYETQQDDVFLTGCSGLNHRGYSKSNFPGKPSKFGGKVHGGPKKRKSGVHFIVTSQTLNVVSTFQSPVRHSLWCPLFSHQLDIQCGVHFLVTSRTLTVVSTFHIPVRHSLYSIMRPYIVDFTVAV